MSRARETTRTFFLIYVSPLTSDVEKPVRNAVRRFSCMLYIYIEESWQGCLLLSINN